MRGNVGPLKIYCIYMHIFNYDLVAAHLYVTLELLSNYFRESPPPTPRRRYHKIVPCEKGYQNKWINMEAHVSPIILLIRNPYIDYGQN